VEEAYAEWEKAPDYCPYNKRGFGAGYRAATQATATQPAQTQVALTDEQREAIGHLIARGSTFPDHNGSKGPVTRVDYVRLQTAAKVLSALLAAHPEIGGKS
jgi:hypothetical protein